MILKRRLAKQQGLSIIEFTIVSTVFLLLLFAAIEFSRLIFNFQLVNEITRKAARLATVCYVTEKSQIPSLDSITKLAPKEFSSAKLTINYLDGAGNVIDVSLFNNGSASVEQLNDIFTKIRFVRAEVEGVSIGLYLLSGLLGDSLLSPSFETTLPAESLGVYRPIGDTESLPAGNTSCL